MPIPHAKRKICQYLQKTLQKQKSYFSRSAPSHKKTRVSLEYPASDRTPIINY